LGWVEYCYDMLCYAGIYSTTAHATPQLYYYAVKSLTHQHLDADRSASIPLPVKRPVTLFKHP